MPEYISIPRPKVFNDRILVLTMQLKLLKLSDCIIFVLGLS
jgi:hypothetical protein